MTRNVFSYFTCEIWVTIGVIVTGVAIFLFQKNYGEKRILLKNGRYLVRPARVPILGILTRLRTWNIIQLFQELSETYGPMVEIYIGSRRSVLISDSECAKELLAARPKYFRRSQIFDNAVRTGKLDRSLFFSHGTTWTQARRFTAPSFNKQNINAHCQSIWEEANRWTNHLLETYTGTNDTEFGKPFEFKFEAFRYTLNVITKVGFGIDSNNSTSYFHQDQFRNDINDLFRFFIEIVAFPLPGFLWKYSSNYKIQVAAMEANQRWGQACLEQIQAKRGKEPSAIPTLLDSLLRKEEGDMLSDQDVLQNVKVFYLAGSETTSIAISYVIYFLCLNSDILEKMRIESDSFYADVDQTKENIVDVDEITRLLPYTEAVLKETIRLCSPAASVTSALEDGQEPFTFSNGVTIRPGDDACVYIDGILRNPEYFEDPFAFKPDRWLDKNEEKRMKCEANLMAFGFGPRICPGMRLAMVEGILALVSLVHRLEFQLACDPKEIKRVMLFTTGPNKVPLFVKRRKF